MRSKEEQCNRDKEKATKLIDNLEEDYTVKSFRIHVKDLASLRGGEPTPSTIGLTWTSGLCIFGKPWLDCTSGVQSIPMILPQMVYHGPQISANYSLTLIQYRRNIPTTGLPLKIHVNINVLLTSVLSDRGITKRKTSDLYNHNKDKLESAGKSVKTVYVTVYWTTVMLCENSPLRKSADWHTEHVAKPAQPMKCDQFIYPGRVISSENHLTYFIIKDPNHRPMATLPNNAVMMSPPLYAVCLGASYVCNLVTFDDQLPSQDARNQGQHNIRIVGVPGYYAIFTQDQPTELPLGRLQFSVSLRVLNTPSV
ncbi:hypothetical protein T265_07188 [Opisthorchis viverrini]|uniref:Uncharacterized protein n=1 Tax=Opisthorchis viverrini TaxID=6198 RepID=A0A074ZHS6_OPIVI|nr:hypothetical protein T265_07188 [Opisthorchis viverrini]KER25307.1 hypothetical protein T265_07188 [Opisthorchis viverrini]